MSLKIPKPLKEEHDELHSTLAKATQVTGKLGVAAKSVARIMHPHFVKEEEFALPPLGVLSLITAGEIPAEWNEILQMTKKLKAELPQMIQEHQAIVTALKTLIRVAKHEQKPEYVKFAEQLIRHAKTEEEVLYPTAILIGEFLHLKLN